MPKAITICQDCGKEKEKTIRPNGNVRYICRPCHREKSRQYRRENPEPTHKATERNRKWRQSELGSAYFKRDDIRLKLKEYYVRSKINKKDKPKIYEDGAYMSLHYLNCKVCNVKEIKKRNGSDIEICNNCKAKIQSYIRYGGLFRKCIICENGFNAWYGRSNACSDECARKRDAIRKAEARRISKYKKRARMKIQFVENVYRTKVFDRDKWKCAMCKTKLSKDSTDITKMPTLDHIVPLAKGGSHSMSNVQTLCFNCNTRKNDKAIGQQISIFCKTT